jgi:hypothetical protein
MAGNVTATVAPMARLGAATPLRALQWRVGLERDFGGRGRGAKGAFLGGAFLVAEPGFEPSNLFLLPVDDQLLFQALWTIVQPEFRRL